VARFDQSRVAYLRYLRRERRQSLRAEADADHVKVNTDMLQLRLMEKKREPVRRGDINELIDSICGVVLTHLSSLCAADHFLVAHAFTSAGAISMGTMARKSVRPQ
jgi:hypothetical protein